MNGRSLKKGPYIHYKLEKKVLDVVENKKKVVIKTWSTCIDDLSGFCRTDYRRS